MNSKSTARQVADLKAKYDVVIMKIEKRGQMPAYTEERDRLLDQICKLTGLPAHMIAPAKRGGGGDG